MELTLAIAIGVLTGSGVWLVLRPRTYQLVIGLSLLSYAVNLFIFSMGRLRVGAAPVLGADGTAIAALTVPYITLINVPAAPDISRTIQLVSETTAKLSEMAGAGFKPDV